jgi:hypothetical protein
MSAQTVPQMIIESAQIVFDRRFPLGGIWNVFLIEKRAQGHAGFNATLWQHERKQPVIAFFHASALG